LFCEQYLSISRTNKLTILKRKEARQGKASLAQVEKSIIYLLKRKRRYVFKSERKQGKEHRESTPFKTLQGRPRGKILAGKSGEKIIKEKQKNCFVAFNGLSAAYLQTTIDLHQNTKQKEKIEKREKGTRDDQPNTDEKSREKKVNSKNKEAPK
jgi:hypothetical protein